ncbi:MAG: TIGR02186 family protein [Actinomycetota bacterium]|nr:TIGR02186 family protein [Actinomycetota bacterium]
MRDSKFIKIIAIVILMVLSSLLAFLNTALAQLDLNVGHSHIKIDILYHGSTVDIKGETDRDADLIIKIKSPESESVLRKKGRVGFLWMNTGKLRFENVPNVYFLYSTRDLKDILSQKEMDRYNIGYAALEKSVKIYPINSSTEKDKWFSEFVKFKEASGLYNISSRRISVVQRGNIERYSIKVDWPYQVPPGHYTVTVYEIRNKKVIDKSEASISVERSGFVKIIAEIANKNGALYGILSVVIALAVGFGISLIFKKP